MLNVRRIRGPEDFAETVEVIEGKTDIVDSWDQLVTGGVVLQKDHEGHIA